MDHLPTPNNFVSNERTIVPYVCMKHYDGGPFLTYPIREGITHALPPDGNIPGGSPYRQHEQRYPTPKQEQEDFLQRWLFFGLIHEILGDRYRPEELTRTIHIDDDETSIVSTSGLVEILDSWIADIHAGIVEPHHSYEHIAECLRLTFATIHGAGPDFDLRIKISLASLGELFTLAANEAFDATENNKCPIVFSRLIGDSYWEKSMLSSGWCPNQMKAFVGGTAPLQTLQFLACLGQPACGELHRKCNNHRCLAYQKDLPEYQTKHIVAGCSCEHFLIDTKRLTEILETGYVPLLRIQKGHTLDELSVELVPLQSTSPYMALSHVWADGLGNPYENALPRCQLDFLLQTIHNYYAIVSPQATEEVLLWCDTLCCPVEPGKAKNMALTRMKKIYLEATRVLVLDASIRTYDYQTMDAVEACVRILTSGWTRRLWTLQEGTLPAKNHRLSFLFKDQVINAQKLTHKMFQIRESTVGRKGLIDDIVFRMTNFAPISTEYEGDRREDLGTMEARLRHRSVSVSSDEPLLIANLLDLDVANILNGPCPLANCAKSNCVHSRIHRMWLLMPTAFRGIPRNVLLRVGPRLSEPGFRWAPSTLLYDEAINLPLSRRNRDKNISGSVFGSKGVLQLSSSTYETACIRLARYPHYYIFKLTRLSTESTSRGTPTSRGFLVFFTGYSLSMAECPLGLPSNPWNLIGQEGDRGLYTRGVDGTWYRISRRCPVEQDSFLSAKSLRAIIKEEGNLWITHVESAWNNHELVAEAKGEQQIAIGLLVQLLSDEEGIKYVRSKLHVSIRILEKSLRILLEAAYQSAKQVSQDLLAKGSSPKFDVEQNEVKDVNSAQHRSVLEVLEQECHQVAIQNASQDVTAAATVWSANVIVLFQEMITTMVVGGYGCLGPRTAEEQQWCFD